MTEHETFTQRLAEFQAAAHALSDAWNGAYEVENYPHYLPSFDEFAVDFSAVHATPAIEGKASEIKDDPDDDAVIDAAGEQGWIGR